MYHSKTLIKNVLIFHLSWMDHMWQTTQEMEPALLYSIFLNKNGTENKPFCTNLIQLQSLNPAIFGSYDKLGWDMSCITHYCQLISTPAVSIEVQDTNTAVESEAKVGQMWQKQKTLKQIVVQGVTCHTSICYSYFGSFPLKNKIMGKTPGTRNLSKPPAFKLLNTLCYAFQIM